MDDQPVRAELIAVGDTDAQLIAFERALLKFLEMRGLPAETVLVGVDDRTDVFGNFDRAMRNLPMPLRQQASYLSKFAAAVAAGLFDAALNYLWDETVSQLRKRVANYDLPYFFDNAFPNSERRQRLSSEDDLTKIDDSDLILGARAIGLLSDTGYRRLDFIRFMRNWASAAHPNNNGITGYDLIGWLQTCINEVMSVQIENTPLDIQKHLGNIKSQVITAADAEDAAVLIAGLSQQQVNSLALGYFGIYTRSDSAQQARQNIQHLLPTLWDRVDEPTRQQFGAKWKQFTINNDQTSKRLAQQFLDLVVGDAYKPDDSRAIEIATAIENLLSAHRNFGNFRNEPPFARALQRLVGEHGRVPTQISSQYVGCLVEVFLTNGLGESWAADPIYRELLNYFDATQALTAILAFSQPVIASKLQFPRCRERYLELLALMEQKVSAPAVKELITAIQAFSGPLERMSADSHMKQRVRNLQKLLNDPGQIRRRS